MFLNFVVLKVLNLLDKNIIYFSSGINLLSIVKEDLCKFDLGFFIFIRNYKYLYFCCILKYLFI